VVNPRITTMTREIKELATKVRMDYERRRERLEATKDNMFIVV
jgi:hypothetical protein